MNMYWVEVIVDGKAIPEMQSRRYLTSEEAERERLRLMEDDRMQSLPTAIVTVKQGFHDPNSKPKSN
jgi:hypothetical protein